MADRNSIICQKSTANVPAIVTSAGTAIADNPARAGWSIQNCDTDPLFVLLGSGASTSVFHYILKGGSGADDGLGGLIAQTSGTVYTGIITVAGTTPRFVITEF